MRLVRGGFSRLQSITRLIKSNLQGKLVVLDNLFSPCLPRGAETLDFLETLKPK